MIEALSQLIVTGLFLLLLAAYFDRRTTRRETASLDACHDVRRGAQAIADQAGRLKRIKRRPA